VYSFALPPHSLRACRIAHRICPSMLPFRIHFHPAFRPPRLSSVLPSSVLVTDPTAS
jgi:hypothetical protein